MPIDVLIKEKATGSLVVASLIEEVGASDLANAEMSWGPVRDAAVATLQSQGHTDSQIADRLQHAHWDWIAKTPLLSLLAFKCVGIKIGGEWQGFALLQTGTKFASLSPDQGKPLVYVNYLESAPWNLAHFVERPKYGLIGFRLIEYAVRYSQAQGFHGRVGLLALPQAEPFYEKGCGMAVSNERCNTEWHGLNLRVNGLPRS